MSDGDAAKLADELLPCPWCAKPLYIKRGKINPTAYCRTEDCFGRRTSCVNLDDPRDVAAWNTRASLQLRRALEELIGHWEKCPMWNPREVRASIDRAYAALSSEGQEKKSQDGGDVKPEGVYEGKILIDAHLLHNLWCYGALRPVEGVVYSRGSHQKCLDEVDRIFFDRARALNLRSTSGPSEAIALNEGEREEQTPTKEDFAKWSRAWRDTCETIMTLLDLRGGGSPQETLKEVQDFVARRSPADKADVPGLTLAMGIVASMRQSEAGLFDEKHSGRRGCDRSDALYDAYIAIQKAAAPDKTEGR